MVCPGSQVGFPVVLDPRSVPSVTCQCPRWSHLYKAAPSSLFSPPFCHFPPPASYIIFRHFLKTVPSEGPCSPASLYHHNANILITRGAFISLFPKSYSSVRQASGRRAPAPSRQPRRRPRAPQPMVTPPAPSPLSRPPDSLSLCVCIPPYLMFILSL